MEKGHRDKREMIIIKKKHLSGQLYYKFHFNNIYDRGKEQIESPII